MPRSPRVRLSARRQTLNSTLFRTNKSPGPNGASVVIAGRTLPVSPVLDTLFEWMAERDRIRRKRRLGDPPPWTQDQILNDHEFWNVFRIYDDRTQYVLSKVINTGSQDYQEVCFRVILFKLFNRISTWEMLNQKLGPLSFASFDLKAYQDVLAEACKSSPLYGGAYQISEPPLGERICFMNSLRLLQLMMDEDLPGQLLHCKHMRDAFEIIHLYPGMGDFLSFQLLLDLNMTPHLNFPENKWAICGPGSRACLRVIFGPRVRGIESEAIAYLHSTQAEHFTRLGITDLPSKCGAPPGVSFVDIEHSLCECSKYLRRQHQHQGVRGGGEASNEPLTSGLPTRWMQRTCVEPARAESSAMADIAPSLVPKTEEGGKDLREISHIVKEKHKSGAVSYLVRWAGFGPDGDTWRSAADLICAHDALSKWRARGLLKEAIDRRVRELCKDHGRTKVARGGR